MGRKIFIWLLLAVLFFSSFPTVTAFAAGESADFLLVTDSVQLTSGRYILLTDGRQAPGNLLEQYGCAEAMSIFPVRDTITCQETLGWILTFSGSSVTIHDGAGTYISPSSDSTNLKAGIWNWQIHFQGGMASFSTTCSDKTVYFAQNLSNQNRFRAYSLEEMADTANYRYQFFLYKIPASEPDPIPTESTEGDTTPTTDPEEIIPSPPMNPTDPSEPQIPGWGIYFGHLHGHSSISDALSTPAEAYTQAKDLGMDFYSLTDQSNSFSQATDWTVGKTEAEKASNSNFAALFGFEMAWPPSMDMGHISVWNTDHYVSWKDAQYDSVTDGLENFYDYLLKYPHAVAQFCHPGDLYGDFQDYGHYSQALDDVICLIEFTQEKEYRRALNAGWHVSPTVARDSQGRTAVVSDGLTEDMLYAALKNRRTYATKDTDLQILYSLDGYPMGDIVPLRELDKTCQILVFLQDPQDKGETNIQVITPSGSVQAEGILSGNGTIAFSVPTNEQYYYLRITQADGDVAVTAPVWIDQTEDLGISALTSSPTLLVQGEPAEFSVTLFNEEEIPFLIKSADLFLDGERIHTVANITLASHGSWNHTFSYRYTGAGPVTLKVHVAGTLADQTRTFSKELLLGYYRPDLVTDLLVDGTHGSTAAAQVEQLTQIAARNRIQVSIITGNLSSELLDNCGILLIPAPQKPFEESFLKQVREFVEYGGTLILCGEKITEENRLLEALGSTVSYTDIIAEGPYHIDRAAPWCHKVTENQFYYHQGITMNSGEGTCLVTDSSDRPVLVWESIGAGQIFTGGAFFLSDDALADSLNIWDEPYANYTIAQAILGDKTVRLPISTIQDIRSSGGKGQTYRIRGYVTAGTSNPYTTFPGTVYLQDNTGGIALKPFFDGGIQIGTPLEAEGVLAYEGRNPVLQILSWKQLDASPYRYVPENLSIPQATNFQQQGGRVVQAEGIVEEVFLSPSGLLTGFVLEDSAGNEAYIWIQDGIFSGSTGWNVLSHQVKVGRQVRAIGILFDHSSLGTVLRVRNCDEVVYIPPSPYTETEKETDIPDTGDPLRKWIYQLFPFHTLADNAK